MDLVELFPPFGLRIQLGPVELRIIQQDDLPALLTLIEAGVVTDSLPSYPFLGPFALGEATPQRRLDSLRFWWSSWATMTPQKWSLIFAVRRDGELVGVQDLTADDFVSRRQATSGSWLGIPHQGRGTGTLMRQALCLFAIDQLGAEVLRSSSFADNIASIAVSRRVGYQSDGQELAVRGSGEPGPLVKFRLTPETLVRPKTQLIVEGLTPFRSFIGL